MSGAGSNNPEFTTTADNDHQTGECRPLLYQINTGRPFGPRARDIRHIHPSPRALAYYYYYNNIEQARQPQDTNRATFLHRKFWFMQAIGLQSCVVCCLITYLVGLEPLVSRETIIGFALGYAVLAGCVVSGLYNSHQDGPMQWY